MAVSAKLFGSKTELQSILKIADSKIADFWLFLAIILKIDIYAPK